MEIYLFRLKGNPLILVGQKNEVMKTFFILKDDGTIYTYDFDNVLWSKFIGKDDLTDLPRY